MARLSIAEILGRAMVHTGQSQTQLAKRAGIAPSFVWSIVHKKNENPRLSTLRALAKGLGADLNVAFVFRRKSKKTKRK